MPWSLAEAALHAFEASEPVLVEKPMAIRLADADRMIEAARQRKLVLQVGQQSRHSSAYHSPYQGWIHTSRRRGRT